MLTDRLTYKGRPIIDKRKQDLQLVTQHHLVRLWISRKSWMTTINSASLSTMVLKLITTSVSTSSPIFNKKLLPSVLEDAPVGYVVVIGPSEALFCPTVVPPARASRCPEEKLLLLVFSECLKFTKIKDALDTSQEKKLNLRRHKNQRCEVSENLDPRGQDHMTAEYWLKSDNDQQTHKYKKTSCTK